MVVVTERSVRWSPEVNRDEINGNDYILGRFDFEPRGLAPTMWCKVYTGNNGYVTEVLNDYVSAVPNEIDRRKHDTLQEAIDYCELRAQHYVMLVNADYPELIRNYDARMERGSEMRDEFERIKSGLRLEQW